MPVSEIPSVLKDLSMDRITWADVCQKYPKFEQQEATK